jgi:hypothetical protein
MTKENRDYLEVTYHSINCFADDGKLDISELNELVGIALRDGVVDDNEKRVLNNIIKRLNAAELTPEMMARIGDLRKKYGI